LSTGAVTGHMTEGDTWINAAIGAVVTIVCSFVPVSPVFGGAVAAYLQEGPRMEGPRVGGLSGVLAAIPLALFIGLFGILFLGVVGGGGSSLVLLPLFLLVLLVTVAYSAALGAVGGYLVVYLVEEDVL